ncbi:GNAT family N-acetyltransferase [Pedobacter aquatilis]|uniref:GNAT family N-acetyltransferase n=1 Tax=Pedobacter aquatilis TaxID=351343 RepID=UPI0025B3973F|nr:GNAT family N-acetyltransferase [Pedobacter aquatilis]MDN3587991.1 GNAT family N-acetyltransferase [Pedobacter aquatilis]
MTLETDRLILHPLTHNQLLKYVRNNNSLEKELKLKPGKNIISEELEAAIRETILPNVIDSNKNYLYNTLWSIISKADEKLIGDLCFVGEPDANGEIEIGYGTYPEFRNNGYMTEAVSRLIQWAATQPEVKMITASTEIENVASYSILEKNNFIKIAEGEGMFTWKLNLK